MAASIMGLGHSPQSLDMTEDAQSLTTSQVLTFDLEPTYSPSIIRTSYSPSLNPSSLDDTPYSFPYHAPFEPQDLYGSYNHSSSFDAPSFDGSQFESPYPSSPSDPDSASLRSPSPSPSVASLRRRKSSSSLRDASPERRPKKADADYVRRPPNAWILFHQAACEKYNSAAALAGVAPERKHRWGDLLIFTHLRWKRLPAEEKKHWEDLAKVKKEEHAAQYPDYIYPKPRSSRHHAHEDDSFSSSKNGENQGITYNVTNNTFNYGPVNNVRHIENASFGQLEDPRSRLQDLGREFDRFPSVLQPERDTSHPPHAFVMFSTAIVKARYSSQSTSDTETAVTDIVTDTWRNMSPDDRARIDAEAERADELHLAMLASGEKGVKGEKLKQKYWSFATQMTEFWFRMWNQGQATVKTHLKALGKGLLGIPLDVPFTNGSATSQNDSSSPEDSVKSVSEGVELPSLRKPDNPGPHAPGVFRRALRQLRTKVGVNHPSVIVSA